MDRVTKTSRRLRRDKETETTVIMKMDLGERRRRWGREINGFEVGRKFQVKLTEGTRYFEK